MEASLEHKLGRDGFDSQQVENHVVPQVESRVELILVSLDDFSGDVRLELVVNHHEDETSGIETTSTSSTSHLDVL